MIASIVKGNYLLKFFIEFVIIFNTDFKFRNTFSIKDGKTKKNEKSIAMEAIFRIPRPTFPGFLQSKINEELRIVEASNYENSWKPSKGLATKIPATLQSQGRMFGLTFWENWYILGDSKVIMHNNHVHQKDHHNFMDNQILANPSSPTQNDWAIPMVSASENDINTNKLVNTIDSKKNTEKTSSSDQSPIHSTASLHADNPAAAVDQELKLVFYTGHTLQGSYKGKLFDST